MNDDRFDDGLVHGHDWAREKPATPPRPKVIRAAPEERYDDGLVHGHDWASTGK
jgi:hypothetical protein